MTYAFTHDVGSILADELYSVATANYRVSRLRNRKVLQFIVAALIIEKTYMGKFVLVATLGLSLSVGLYGQDYFAYAKPIEKQVYAPELKDTVKYELILPKAALLSFGIKYPVIVVFDRQNRFSYSNTMNTIDYLTISSAIPNSIIIGISLDQRQRNRWTLPRHRKGMADDFMNFILDKLIVPGPMLAVDNFIFLVGHSRTAIFSSYAISKRYDKIDGIFGASISNFDFGDDVQKKQFEVFLDDVQTMKKSIKYYFSVGDSLSGDGHESEVMKLNNFLNNTNLPANFQHRMYFEKNSNHYTNYGLAVGNALNDAFSEYRHVLKACFKVLNDSKKIVALPWQDFERIFLEYESTTGAKYYPDLTFYNSIASYVFNANNIAEGERNTLLLDVLSKGMTHFPAYDGFYAWAARIQIKENNNDAAKAYLQKALKVAGRNPFLTDSEKVRQREQLQRQLDEIAE